MVIVDFKENLRLGGGPVECGKDYFTRQQCSVLGMAVVYQDQVSKQPCVEYIDFFSDILSHDALFVTGCMSDLLHNFINLKYRNLSLKKVHFWNDTGRHFQCGELAHYLLKIVPVEFNIQVTWNFFVEHHGKSIVDGHFGVLSRMKTQIETRVQVDTIDQLIAELQKKEREAHETEVGEKVIWNFGKYDRENRPDEYKVLNITRMCDYYYFESVSIGGDVFLNGKLLTSSNDYLANFRFSEKVIQETRETKRGSDFVERAKKRTRGQEDGEENNPFGRNV